MQAQSPHICGFGYWDRVSGYCLVGLYTPPPINGLHHLHRVITKIQARQQESS
jgi:hypothetical protein